jgi:class 3 adenylate cyclase/DNA-binding CsgD family transcriptional regulator
MAIDAPQTHYAAAEKNVHVAYQVFGGGTHDLVFVPPFVSNLDVWWELPTAARFFNGLASFARVILLDKRGTGLSDRLSTVETPEERVDDIRAVMDAVGCKKAAIFGASEAVPIAIIFAATYPERTTALLLWGGMARWSPAPDYPWSLTDEMYTKIVELSSSQWGTGFSASLIYPSGADELGIRDWFSRYERVSASPGGFARITLNNTAFDVRSILPSIQAPTLLLHADNDTFVHVGGSRYLASHIPDAKYVELHGTDHLFCGENGDTLVEEIEEFLTGSRHVSVPDRVLATVLFTDIVNSTERAASLGDEAWKKLLERHHAIVRRQLTLFRGRELDTAGDGVFASFDGPARAIRCACAISDSMLELGVAIRAGLHTGECEIVGKKLAGIAVHIGARVAGRAAAGEILVSGTVRDLVAGSGLRFRDQGTASLKGIHGEWRLYAVERNGSPAPRTDPAREAFQAAVERAVGGPRTGPLTPLSKRESEVALLVAGGLTNRQVAGRLFLAERTAEWHVEQILAKLGLTNRAQVASWISERTSPGAA